MSKKFDLSEKRFVVVKKDEVRPFEDGSNKWAVHSQIVRGFTCPQVHLSAGSVVRGFTCPQTCKIGRVGRNNGGIV
jgi:hypothetical protein